MNKTLNYVHDLSMKKDEWVNKTISEAIPRWKKTLILLTGSAKVARMLGVNVEIYTEDLCTSFGEKITITMNGKVIGVGRFDITSGLFGEKITR